MKILSVGAELFHADGRTDRQTDRQTDMTKQIVALRNFAKAPKR
jgi:Fe-S-cluster formation regulator IscX/YfhJ